MTFKPTPDQVAAALEHAAADNPLECCGVIAGGRYWPLKNTATERDAFVMDMRGFIEVEKQHKVEAIVHSHIYAQPVASDGDRAMCEKTGLPWLIVSWPLGNHLVIEPCGYRAPLIGRQWAWGTHDCYGLIRDGFQDYTGILLPDFPREWMWWKEGGDIIADQFAEAGFVRLPPDTPHRHCDLIGMRLHAPVVNHLGLFLAPDILLHQLLGRLSVREPYGGVYLYATVLHLRHRQLIDEPPA